MSQSQTEYGVGNNTTQARNSLFIVAGFAIAFSFIVGERLLLDFGLSLLIFHGILWALSFHAVKALSVQRHATSQAMEEEDIRVHLTLNNSSWLKTTFAACEDFFPVDMSAQHRVVIDGTLGQEQAVKAYYDGHCFNKRGDYQLGPATLIARDPFGITAARRTLGPETCQEFLVLPKVAPVDNELSTHTASVQALLLGQQKTGKQGPGYDLQGLRDYRPGDPLQHIHWRLSAHKHQLIVKQFEHQQPKQVLVILDLILPRLRGIGRHSSHEYAIRAALALVYHTLQQRQPCAMVCHAESSFTTPFYRDAFDLMPTLVDLARVRPAPFTEAVAGGINMRALIQNSLTQLNVGRLSQLQCFVVAPMAYDDLESMTELSKFLNSATGHCHFHVIDISTFHAMNFQKVSQKEEQRRFDAAIFELSQSGSTITVQRNGEDLNQVILRQQQGFSSRPTINLKAKRAKT